VAKGRDIGCVFASSCSIRIAHARLGNLIPTTVLHVFPLLIGAVFSVLRCKRCSAVADQLPITLGSTACLFAGEAYSLAISFRQKMKTCTCSRSRIDCPRRSLLLTEPFSSANARSEVNPRVMATQSSALAAFACSITAGACCVGMRTSVWGNGGPSSAFFSDSSSSFGLGSFAVVVQYLLSLYEKENLLEAMLMARSTLCQFDNTAAIADRPQH
jgi:hypothetical protein